MLIWLVAYKMNRFNLLQRTTDLRPVRWKQLTALLLACVLVAPPVSLVAANRKGDKFWNEARAEEAKGNLDHALQLAEQAYELDPSDIGYQLEVRRVRFEAGEMHIKNGQKLRNAGKLSEALAAAAGTRAAAAGAAGAAGVAVCATLTEETELSTDWAAVAVSPALPRPRTKPRRDSE